HHADEWIAAVEESNKLAEESGDLHLRVAVRAAGSYAFLSAGEFDRFDEALSEILEQADADPSVGAGIGLGGPAAWALMGKGMVHREQGRLEQADELFEQALRVAKEGDDPETASWIRSNHAALMSIRGDVEGGLALARRNCELTNRIGD